MSKLTARQKMFCEYYVASGNATQSAIKAGYSENYAKNRIHELLKNVVVCGYIEELQAKTTNARIMSAIERKEWLTNVLKDENNKLQDKLKAIDILNKMDGEYLEKVQLSGEVKSNPFEKLTVEELKKLAGS